MRLHAVWWYSLVAALGGEPLAASTLGPPKPPWQDRPDDERRVHEEIVSSARHEYVIPFLGTVDGTMTRMPVGYSAFVQGWQPNRSVRMENTGTANVENPRLIVNGRGNWQTLETIVAEATRGWTEPANRARAIWEFVRRHRFHACTWDDECSDAVKALNVYGYTLCGDQARVLSDLWHVSGLPARRGHPVGHVVCEVFYGNGYHLLDSDEHVFCLERDNHTIASEEAIVRDHDLMKRTHTYGIGQKEDRQTDEFSASLYGYEGERKRVFPLATKHAMNLVLRPGESIEYRWDHVGKQYTAGHPVPAGERLRDGLGDLRAGWGETAYDNLRNGRLCYRPDLFNPNTPQGVEMSENVVFDAKTGQIRIATPDQPARITWRFQSPYVFVGGRASAVFAGDHSDVQWHYSVDGQTWTSLPPASGAVADEFVSVLDEVISPRGKPAYRFFLQLTLIGPVAIRGLNFETEVQMAPLALPELVTGLNRVVYADDSSGSREVKISHEWMERSTWHPPLPPPTALAPQDNAEVQGTAVAFTWTEPADPDGDAIADYHFELSRHADMRWPLSSNFEKRISLTPCRGKAAWNVPAPGLLNPGTPYYWRVRAMDAQGVWGAWSPVFRFRCAAPGVPLELRLETAPANQGWLLHWTPNPEGQEPVAYKVYGSDEKGFTASDGEHPVLRGKGFVADWNEYESVPAGAPGTGVVLTPPNLITRTPDTSLCVAGAHATLPNTNKAFYRVVAIDANGNESGPSDYVAMPRPWIVSQPPPGRAGQPYAYRLQAIRSLGDLRCRPNKTSSYNAAFWDREPLSFRAIHLPKGLGLDAETGLIHGTPPAGEFDLELEVRTGSYPPLPVKQVLRVDAR